MSYVALASDRFDEVVRFYGEDLGWIDGDKLVGLPEPAFTPQADRQPKGGSESDRRHEGTPPRARDRDSGGSSHDRGRRGGRTDLWRCPCPSFSFRS